MKFLLDTHTFLWWTLDDPQLSTRARELIADGENEIYLSAASAWEVAIKAAKGRLILPEEPSVYLTSRMNLYRFHPMPIQVSHALRVFDLPAHHNDPFDRLLVAQSQLEKMALLSADAEIRAYAVEVIW
jgi:PIN domain nuclease of toxin-antitoxin system